MSKSKEQIMYYVPRDPVTKPIIEVKARQTPHYIFITDDIGMVHQLGKDTYAGSYHETPESAKNAVLKRLCYWRDVGERRRHWKSGKNWGRQADEMNQHIQNFEFWYDYHYPVWKAILSTP